MSRRLLMDFLFFDWFDWQTVGRHGFVRLAKAEAVRVSEHLTPSPTCRRSLNRRPEAA